MWDLRWVLLGLGALVLCRSVSLERAESVARHAPALPRRKGRTEPEHRRRRCLEPGRRPHRRRSSKRPSEEEKARPRPDRIVARCGSFLAARSSRGTRRGGARERRAEHGRYAIFHRQLGSEPRRRSASRASRNRASFDLDHLGDSTIAGLSFFLVLPGNGDPVARFDAMVETARALSVELAADLSTNAAAPGAVQRERYLREELIEYRHQFERR